MELRIRQINRIERDYVSVDVRVQWKSEKSELQQKHHRQAAHHHEKIHLLLTDLVMAGGTNGLELAERLNTTQPGIKVVYMTGYTADVINPKGMADMQDRILQKPFSSHSLLRKIREVLAG